MGLQTGDIVRVTQYFGQGVNEALMVSYWQWTQEGEAQSQESLVAEAFHKDYSAKIRGFAHHETAFMKKTVVDNLTDGLAYGEYAEQLFGGAAGDAAPSFNAIAVKQNVATRLTRAGQKRIPFIPELRSNGNDVVIGLTDQGKIEAFYGDTWEYTNPLPMGTNEGQMQPIVVGRVETAPGSGIYELDLTKINLVTSAQVTRITSQNSRK